MPAMIVAAVVTGEELPEIGTILSILEVSVVFYLLASPSCCWCPGSCRGPRGRRGCGGTRWPSPTWASSAIRWRWPCSGTGRCFYAAILALPFNLLSFSLGPLLLAGAARFRWKQLFAPCIAASVLGLVLALTRLRPPALVGEILDFTGGITVPLSLLVVGSLLAGMPAGQVLRSPRLWVLTAIRLLVLPATLCLILHPMDLEPLVLGIAVSQMAMPVAVNGTLLSMEVRRRHGVHGPDHLPDHGVLHRHHPIVPYCCCEPGKEIEMPHIQQLESHVADLIAAGEAVEQTPAKRRFTGDL